VLEQLLDMHFFALHYSEEELEEKRKKDIKPLLNPHLPV
jgi:hypothetical protein